MTFFIPNVANRLSYRLIIPVVKVKYTHAEWKGAGGRCIGNTER